MSIDLLTVKKFYTTISMALSVFESLRYLKKKGIIPKLIHVSTDEVYGDIKKGEDLMKSTDMNQALLTQHQKLAQII